MQQWWIPRMIVLHMTRSGRNNRVTGCSNCCRCSWHLRYSCVNWSIIWLSIVCRSWTRTRSWSLRQKIRSLRMCHFLRSCCLRSRNISTTRAVPSCNRPRPVSSLHYSMNELLLLLMNRRLWSCLILTCCRLPQMIVCYLMNAKKFGMRTAFEVQWLGPTNPGEEIF